LKRSHGIKRHLSVFVGAFTLDSAHAVAADGNVDVVEAVALYRARLRGFQNGAAGFG